MIERPILFSGPMVCALLRGSKTQTRRPVKQVPHWDHRGKDIMEWGLSDCYTDDDGHHWLDIQTDVDDNSHEKISCPFGQPGDRLWVRETWAHYQTVNHRRCSDGRSFDEVSDGLAGYRADGHNTIEDFRNHIRLMSGCDLEAVLINGDRWSPSIHMPRWACRLVLEIVSVRVERVQEINEADCWAEGIAEIDGQFDGATICATAKRIGCSPEDARATYSCLWDSIYAAKGQDWDTNPWVWVAEFKRVEVSS